MLVNVPPNWPTFSPKSRSLNWINRVSSLQSHLWAIIRPFQKTKNIVDIHARVNEKTKQNKKLSCRPKCFESCPFRRNRNAPTAETSSGRNFGESQKLHTSPFQRIAESFKCFTRNQSTDSRVIWRPISATSNYTTDKLINLKSSSIKIQLTWLK